jgi:hypothetical protein
LAATVIETGKRIRAPAAKMVFQFITFPPQL